MSSQRGYSLLEATTSLAIFAILIVSVAQTLDKAPGVIARLEARQILISECERSLESLRAGRLPLASGPIRLEAQDPRLTLEAVVTTGDLPDLWSVTIVARIELRGETLDQHLQSAIWRQR